MLDLIAFRHALRSLTDDFPRIIRSSLYKIADPDRTVMIFTQS